MFLSLVIPAYNESKRIGRCISDIKSFFQDRMSGIEVLIVIEKSTDGTLEIARKAVGDDTRFTVIDNQIQKGKGFAVKSGMLKAKGQYVFFMDCDLSTPLVEVLNFLAHLEAHPEVEVLIGSRRHHQSQMIKKQNVIRRKMGQVFNFFVQMFAVKGIRDTQCGFKAFRQHAVQPIFSRQKIDGFSFDVEILLLADFMGFKIDVLGVKWINSPETKVRIVRDSLKMFLDLLRMKAHVRQTLRASPFQKALK